MPDSRNPFVQMVVLSAVLFVTPVFAQTTRPATGDQLETLLSWMTGDFDNAVQVAGLPPDDDTFSHLGLQRRRVNVPALGGHVIYAQINRRADPADVYRQYFISFTVAEDGSLHSRNYRLRDAGRLPGILSTPTVLARLHADDFEPALPEGCNQSWYRDGEAFVARIDRTACVITSRRDGTPRHIQATEIVDSKRIRNEESGYLPDGTMIFGVPDGQLYEYLKK